MLGDVVPVGLPVGGWILSQREGEKWAGGEGGRAVDCGVQKL